MFLINLSGMDSRNFSQLNPQYKTTDYVISSKDNIILPLSNENTYLASIGKFQTPINDNQIVLNVFCVENLAFVI